MAQNHDRPKADQKKSEVEIPTTKQELDQEQPLSQKYKKGIKKLRAANTAEEMQSALQTINPKIFENTRQMKWQNKPLKTRLRLFAELHHALSGDEELKQMQEELLDVLRKKTEGWSSS